MTAPRKVKVEDGVYLVNGWLLAIRQPGNTWRLEDLDNANIEGQAGFDTLRELLAFVETVARCRWCRRTLRRARPELRWNDSSGERLCTARAGLHEAESDEEVSA